MPSLKRHSNEEDEDSLSQEEECDLDSSFWAYINIILLAQL